jgi:2-dehydro-3-deoxy-phosphogluconate/2-dehydro-3-deoxy-6-phosphogalactonate aldolase
MSDYNYTMSTTIVPMLTPFEGTTINTEHLRNHAQQLFHDDVDLIFLCGTTGLGPALSFQEKSLVLQSLKDSAERIIFQVGGLDLAESLKLAEMGKNYGVRAISAYPPYYFPRLRDDWVVKYFTQLSKVHPLIVYNFPLATGYDVTSTIVKKAIDEGANIIGVKDTVNDIAHMFTYKWEIGKDFLVYSGPDTIVLSAARSGMDGSVAGTGNYVTELLVKLVNEPNSADSNEVQRLITDLAMIARKYGQWAANYSLTKLIRRYEVDGPKLPIYPLSQEDLKKLDMEVRALLTHPSNKMVTSYLKRFGK